MSVLLARMLTCPLVETRTERRSTELPAAGRTYTVEKEELAPIGVSSRAQKVSRRPTGVRPRTVRWPLATSTHSHWASEVIGWKSDPPMDASTVDPLGREVVAE
ncbi:hypothetical protein WEI85_05970 [Actinomycetes bacterium KLBMP 9797]